MSYIPPYQITDKILSLVADISEKIGKINERTNLDSDNTGDGSLC